MINKVINKVIKSSADETTLFEWMPQTN
jgi:hypothetical protein